MDPRTAKRVEDMIGYSFLAAFLWLIWGWWSFSGLYRLIALIELKLFGSYGVIITFAAGIVGLAVAMLLILKLLQPFGVSAVTRGPRPTPAEAKAKVECGMGKFMLAVGALALIVVVTAAAGLIRDSHRNATIAILDLSSPSPLPPGTDLVRLIGFSRPELIAGVETRQTPGVDTSSESFMAVVGPHWQAGETVPVIVQGSPALGLNETTVQLEERGRVLPVRLPIAIVRSTTSGFAEYLLERNGARTDAHTIVLDTDLNSVRSRLWTVFALSLLVALVGLGIGSFTLRAPSQQPVKPR